MAVFESSAYIDILCQVKRGVDFFLNLRLIGSLNILKKSYKI